MTRRLRASVWIVASFLLPIAIGEATHLLQPGRLMLSEAANSAATPICQTIIADPNPPLNVRSSPVVASDNMVGRLPNGTPLLVLDENQGWLRINSPIQGWVYKELTVTSCVGLADAAHAVMSAPVGASGEDQGTRLLAIATEQYQSGNLNNAIALAKTVSPTSPAYASAEAAIAQWQLNWSRAEADYYSAQTALRNGKWQAVLGYVNGYPDIRYWKERLAPVVQQAVRRQR